MTNPRHNLRDIYPPTGPEKTAKTWAGEAAMRMLMNNLHPDVAENPHELVVYGGIGRAARTWEDFDRIVAGLKDLEADETLKRRVLGLDRTRSERQIDIAEAIAPVHVRGILGRVHQWIGSTGEHRHVLAASDFAQFQRIAHRVAETDVARRHGQADHVVALVGKSHQQRQRVVHAGVSVDQQGNLLAHFLHRF